LLREELGFTGVITTDALEMQAITKTQSIEDAAVASIRAGADLAMIAVGAADPQALTQHIVDAVGNGSLPAERVADAAARVRALAASLAERKRQTTFDGAAIREVAERVVAGQTFPALGATPYVIDLTQGLHPAWYPYFSGLPELFAKIAPGSDGVVLRDQHRLSEKEAALFEEQHAEGEQSEDALTKAAAAAQGRPLVIAVQDAGRTPWIREALEFLLQRRDDVFVLCTGIPEDQALVPEGVPSATTSGRNVIVLEAVVRALTRDA